MYRLALPQDARRTGAVTPFLLIAATVFLGALAIAVDYAFLWQTRVEMQDTADAAAHAAVAALVDDDYLVGDPVRSKRLMDIGRADAVRFAAANPVQGRPTLLDPNLANDLGGSIVFGRVDTPRSRTLVGAENVDDPGNDFLTRLNAVRVYVRRTRAGGNPVRTLLGWSFGIRTADAQAAATATLDQDVIGFRPVGNSPVPMSPLALRSDLAGVDPLTWDFAVTHLNGPDVYRFDRGLRVVVPDPAGDGLPEMTVTLGAPGGPPENANGALLQLGVTTAGRQADQFRNGLTADDLAGFGGQLALDSTNRLDVPGSIEGPTPGSGDDAAIRQALSEIQATGAQRIWPLYTSADSQTVELAGFVAARVAAVTPANPGQPISFVLQPTFMATRTALTDTARRGVGGSPVPTPFVARIRLVG